MDSRLNYDSHRMSPFELVSMEAGFCTTTPQIHPRSAKARIHRDKLGGVGATRCDVMANQHHRDAMGDSERCGRFL